MSLTARYVSGEVLARVVVSSDITVAELKLQFANEAALGDGMVVKELVCGASVLHDGSVLQDICLLDGDEVIATCGRPTITGHFAVLEDCPYLYREILAEDLEVIFSATFHADLQLLRLSWQHYSEPDRLFRYRIVNVDSIPSGSRWHLRLLEISEQHQSERQEFDWEDCKEGQVYDATLCQDGVVRSFVIHDRDLDYVAYEGAMARARQVRLLEREAAEAWEEAWSDELAAWSRWVAAENLSLREEVVDELECELAHLEDENEDRFLVGWHRWQRRRSRADREPESFLPSSWYEPDAAMWDSVRERKRGYASKRTGYTKTGYWHTE